MAFAMRLAEESPDNIPEIQELTKKIFDIDFQYYPNQEKHDVIHKVRNRNKLVTGFLEDALKVEFPDANTSIYMGKSNPDLVVLLIPKTDYINLRHRRKIFSALRFSVLLPG